MSRYKHSKGCMTDDADIATMRIILADSQAVYRVGILQILTSSSDMRVIAQVNTLAGVRSAIDRYFTHLARPRSTASTIVLLEGNMISGAVGIISELVRRTPQLKIIVQSAQSNESNTVELYRHGVRGVIPRSISPDLLVKCVRKIAAGETWIDNQSVNWVIDAYRSSFTPSSIPRDQALLSPKERSVLTCIMKGQCNKEIAHDLGTTEQVIKNYLSNIYRKLAVSDRVELALYGLRNPSHIKGLGVIPETGAPIN
jgi:DNA-binding NarL/FixJ family response regulator